MKPLLIIALIILPSCKNSLVTIQDSPRPPRSETAKRIYPGPDSKPKPAETDESLNDWLKKQLSQLLP